MTQFETEQQLERTSFACHILFSFVLAWMFIHATGCSALVEEKNDPNDSGTDSSSLSSSDATDSSSTTEGPNTETGSSDSNSDLGTISDTEVPTDSTGGTDGTGLLDTESGSSTENGTDFVDTTGHPEGSCPNAEERVCATNGWQYYCDPEWLEWRRGYSCGPDYCKPLEWKSCAFRCDENMMLYEINESEESHCPEGFECKEKPITSSPYCVQLITGA